MAEILGHRSAVPVSSAAHGAVLRRGRAYVAVPGRHLAVERGGLLALSEGTKVHHLRPSADVLFASMADSLGPRAVAVVLTGAGVDGAAGVRSIRARGGRVLVQDEGECEIPGMPRAAIATGAVDRVLSIDEMPDALMELTRRRR
jgi:two-component system chemotaxis response regulator CheB